MMATTAVHPEEQYQEQAHGYDDSQAAAFQALEQRVLRAIDLLRKERELRVAAEQQLHRAEEHGLEMELQLEEQAKQLAAQVATKTAEVESHASLLQDREEHIRRMENDLSQLQGERDQVRQRVERLLQHLDEFTGA